MAIREERIGTPLHQGPDRPGESQEEKDDAEDYINEHRIDKGIEEMKKENQNAQ